MGDSGPCLMHAFSYTSGMPNQAQQVRDSLNLFIAFAFKKRLLLFSRACKFCLIKEEGCITGEPDECTWRINFIWEIHV